MKIIAIIPARWSSTILPGKPLSDINGKPMIQWVYEAVKKSNVSEVIVATDDERIKQTVLGFGGKAVMTSEHHATGTDRVLEAYDLFKDQYDFVINVQGDEPMINHDDIDRIIMCLKKSPNNIATLVGPLTNEQLTDRNTVKAYIDHDQVKMFTRSPLYAPQIFFKRHIGIYGFSNRTIEKIVSLQQTENELAENLEQIRWADNGIGFSFALTQGQYKGIDTQKDLENYRTFII